MRYHFHCPVCEKDFNFLRHSVALYIFHVKCPHCRSTLKAVGARITVISIILGFGTVAVLYMQRQTLLNLPINFFIPIGIVVLYSVLGSLILANKTTLSVIKNRYTPK